jgi:hypothetical protein
MTLRYALGLAALAITCVAAQEDDDLARSVRAVGVKMDCDECHKDDTAYDLLRTFFRQDPARSLA